MTDYTTIKLKDFIVEKIKNDYPELAKKMRLHPQPTNLLSAFLAIVTLENSDGITPEFKEQILKAYKLL